MAKKKQKKKKKMPEQVQRPKDFLDMIAPAAVKFNTDHFILGSRYHTAMTLKSYPPMTDELARSYPESLSDAVPALPPSFSVLFSF